MWYARRGGEAAAFFLPAQGTKKMFVSGGFAVPRGLFMYNDFVLVGPKADPAGTRGKDIAAALQKLAAAPGTAFVSRGDKSGTHAAEPVPYTNLTLPEKRDGEISGVAVSVQKKHKTQKY